MVKEGTKNFFEDLKRNMVTTEVVTFCMGVSPMFSDFPELALADSFGLRYHLYHF